MQRPPVPEARVIALLVNPDSPQTEPMMPIMQEAARTKQVSLRVLNARNEDEIDGAFASLAQLQASGMVVQGDPVFGDHPKHLVMLAARYAVPAIYARRSNGRRLWPSIGTATAISSSRCSSAHAVNHTDRP